MVIDKRPIKVALVSCGLGHINRGVEVSTARWYQALKNNKLLEVRLFSGGDYREAKRVSNVPRDLLLKTMFAPLAGLNNRRIWEFCYGVEQLTFAGGFGSTLLSWQPDIVWTKETPFAHTLVATRPIFNLKYKLIFSNGCGFKPATYAHFDHIQHLHQKSFDEARNFGISEAKMTVLPNLMPMPVQTKSKAENRKFFGYKPDDWVIICLAAWNRHHKRIDYLIEEVAKIPDDRVKLLLCGQPEPDTAYLKNLAQKLLPNRVQWHTLPAEEVPIALGAADVFVLPSLDELFGGVIIEAMMLGVPVIAHQSIIAQHFTGLNLEPYDLIAAGNLTQYLKKLMASTAESEKLNQLANIVQSRFGQETLGEQFIDMVNNAIYQR